MWLSLTTLLPATQVLARVYRSVRSPLGLSRQQPHQTSASPSQAPLLPWFQGTIYAARESLTFPPGLLTPLSFREVAQVGAGRTYRGEGQ